MATWIFKNCKCLKHKIVIQIVSKLAGRLTAGIFSRNDATENRTKRSILGIIFLQFLIFPSVMANPTDSREMPNNMRIITYRTQRIHHVRTCVCELVISENFNIDWSTMVYRFNRMYAIESAAAATTITTTTAIFRPIESL